MRAAVACVIAVATAACHPQLRRGPRADAPDAAYRLDDDADRAEERDRLAAMTPDDPARARLRADIAGVLAARIDDELGHARLRRVNRYLLELVSLWRDDPDRLGAEGAALVPMLVRARDRLSKAGVDDAVLVALVALVETDPGRAAQWHGEIDEVLAFADDLDRAQGGDDAIRARAIPALTPIVDACPVGWLVDRYVDLVTARQVAVNALLLKNGASIELVQAHHDVLEASHQVAGALGRAGRIDDLITRVTALTGLGAERELGVAALAVRDNRDRAEPYVILAKYLRQGRRDDQADDDDPGAAFGVCEAGLTAVPNNTSLLACAADNAAADGRPQLAIRMYEAVFAQGSEDADAAARLAGLYRDRIGQLGFASRLAAARQVSAHLDDFLRQIKGRVPSDKPLLWRRDGDVVLARALVSQGHVDEAHATLIRVAEHAPTVDALEALAAIEVDRGDPAAARTWLEQAIGLGGDGFTDQITRGRLHRLAGEAALLGGEDRTAMKHYVEALTIWASLAGDDDRRIELPPEVNGLRLVESARALWAIGERDKALDVFEAALSVDSDGEVTHQQVVAFLILNHELRAATDAFHRALSSEQIDDERKIYMALWILTEDHRSGEDPDGAAVDFLAARRGEAWSDALARVAAGKQDVDSLEAAARSPSQRAELAFYTATLALGAPSKERVKKLLEQVVDSDLILDFEREAARRALSRQ